MCPEQIYKSVEGERAVTAAYDRMLGRWPVAYDGLRIDTRYGGTFVIASGTRSAPPVVLLHGSATNALAWMGDVAALSRCFRVYAVDLPGEPGRSTHNRPAWDGPAFVEWLVDLLDGLRAHRAALAGISQGGWTALKFAINQPQRVSALVLLAPGGIAPVRPSFLVRAIPLSLLGRPGAEAINRIVLGGQAIDPDALSFMNLILTNFRARIGKEYLFSDEELRRLTMPVLLICGSRDAVRPSAQTAARLGALLPHLTSIMLPEAGHALVNLAPEIVPFLVRAFEAAGTYSLSTNP